MNRIIVAMVALAVTIPAFIKNRPNAHYSTPPTFSVYSSSGKMVMIDGDVRHPGVYVLNANIVTGGAIALAEPVQGQGIRWLKGVERLPLRNGSAIHVVNKPDNSLVITVGSIPTSQRMILGIPLDICHMDAGDFDRLPGIGPVLADRIVNCRQTNGGKLRPIDLLSVPGIGEKKYSVLKKYF